MVDNPFPKNIDPARIESIAEEIDKALIDSLGLDKQAYTVYKILMQIHIPELPREIREEVYRITENNLSVLNFNDLSRIICLWCQLNSYQVFEAISKIGE